MPPHRRQRRGPLGDLNAPGAIRSMVGAVQMLFMRRHKFPIFRDQLFIPTHGITPASTPTPSMTIDVSVAHFNVKRW